MARYPYRQSRDLADYLILIPVTLFGLLILSWPIYTVAYYQADNVRYDCTVEDKESVNSGDSHEYRLYTDCGNFVVSDAFWRGHFRSSDLYRELEVGETYDLYTLGWRVPFLSMFPNVVEAEDG